VPLRLLFNPLLAAMLRVSASNHVDSLLANQLLFSVLVFIELLRRFLPVVCWQDCCSRV
jgi:hypothetical protein